MTRNWLWRYYVQQRREHGTLFISSTDRPTDQSTKLKIKTLFWTLCMPSPTKVCKLITLIFNEKHLAMKGTDAESSGFDSGESENHFITIWIIFPRSRVSVNSLNFWLIKNTLCTFLIKSIASLERCPLFYSQWKLLVSRKTEATFTFEITCYFICCRRSAQMFHCSYCRSQSLTNIGVEVGNIPRRNSINRLVSMDCLNQLNAEIQVFVSMEMLKCALSQEPLQCWAPGRWCAVESFQRRKVFEINWHVLRAILFLELIDRKEGLKRCA